ncbi:4-alpha-glucanotransferase [Phaeobacter sp. J2-8]|uniref:4-alpha-glucanotransferase n=1 Tax=Phaeobacter sp. J2-8 TaxID=2931394 RepID=UPI001FD4BBAF|nr:4-alpha-glucanotransferase [Phaeobacter sp. J2-8]MCJ7872319.1 4-alpha-glucanotransferase [Phaeobacter sp. J2-8]
MNSDDALRQLAQASGVHLEFHDLSGQRQETPPPTLRALLAALGVEAENDAAVTAALAALQAEQNDRHLPEEMILPAGEAVSLPIAGACDWSLLDEDDQELHSGHATTALALPALRVGYYALHLSGPDWREDSFLLARPKHAPKLANATGFDRSWGVTAALYGLRSDRNGGLGNYDDLATTARALAHHGAQFLGVNPLHALGWASQEVISPYSPTHRGFFNTDHIAVDGLGPCPDDALIDYGAFRQQQRPKLEAEFAAMAPSAAFTAFCRQGGPALEAFACYEAISETYGGDSARWPEELQSPGPAAVKAAGRRADFHRWLQWRAETGIDAAQTASRDAGMSLGLYLDLAVGARPGGAEAWMHGDTIARGVSIGAPPDQLSPEGQSWALVAHAPGRLATARYAPMRAMLRKLMRKCGLIRIDHALGLMRSYWLPDDGSPGAYITQPFDSLLAVIAIEAHLANCVVVGEDLGLVPAGFREKMNASGLYSYAVWQYETYDDGWLRDPGDLRPYALACFSTHDTPTLSGFWHGTDISLWEQMGWIGGETVGHRHGTRAHQRESLRRHCGIAHDAGPADVADAIHGTLSRSPAAMSAVQLDDILGVTDAPNLPGTVDEHPNWRRRTPMDVADFKSSSEFERIGVTMRAGDRQPAVSTSDQLPNQPQISPDKGPSHVPHNPRLHSL